MNLLISCLGAIAVNEGDVAAVRAEDATGSFGILRGHADFLTVLDAGVVSWRLGDGRLGHCAVRRGLFTIQGGEEIAIATREAVVASDLLRLETTVLEEFRRRELAEREARVETTRMELRAMREILRYLRPQRMRYQGDHSDRGEAMEAVPG